MGVHLLGPPASLDVRFPSPSSIYRVYHSPLLLLLSPSPFSSCSSKFPPSQRPHLLFLFQVGIPPRLWPKLLEVKKMHLDTHSSSEMLPSKAALEKAAPHSISATGCDVCLTLVLGHGTHDQLCDAVHENLLNSDPEFNTVGQISTLSLQEKGRSQGTSSYARV
ncbi:hypothetical protein C4D60_Mb04t38390 [Musa balbisiana]|uniref:Uncharacterized protein n=1 Tax=Musa balbisiana TaxID=52838 RepID=A0A4S8KHX6_MUSBA|nr:hypothetical protein C4D60_Mb04t38390 [Musa balbisiana]